MEKALLYLGYPTEYCARIIDKLQKNGYEVYHIVPNGKDPEIEKKALEILREAYIAILGAGLPIREIENATRLHWLHYDWVGIEGGISKQIFDNGVFVTNGSGRNSICLSEHVFYFMFSLSYDSRAIFDSQDQHRWGVDRQSPYSSLYGKTMLIAGTGSIAQEVAKRAKAFGMKVIGYSRSYKELDCFDKVYAKEQGYNLEDIVSDADYLIAATALNASSFHMIDEKVFERMKPTSYLINISRGAIIDEKAMINALKNAKIAGAGCDTFEKEPLASESELWDIRNMIITPHSTPQSPLKFDIGTDTIIKNIDRLLVGEKLINQQGLNDILS